MQSMLANPTLYVAALRLYGALLDHDPPDGCAAERWDELVAASSHLYLLAARRRRDGEDLTVALHELACATRECLDLLDAIDLRLPLVRRAWVCLRVVVDELEAELASLPVAALN
jgi:hypothetical protein